MKDSPQADYSALQALMAAVVLEAGGRELTGRDLMAAGVLSERWLQLERELKEGLELVAGDPPSEAETTSELRAFRLQHGLGSAEDLRVWMRERELTLRAVRGVSERVVARRRGAVPAPVPTAQIADALAAEAICSGALKELGWWLADRILCAGATETGAEPISLQRTRVKRLVFAESCTVAGAASGEAGLERGQRMAWIAALDDAYSAWAANASATTEVARRLREHDLDWCRFELDVLHLASPGAAAEAAQRLAESRSPDQVAAMAGVEASHRSLVLADAASAVAGMLAGASAGDVVGPWTDDEEHLVARVRERVAPTIDDAESLARAREALLVDAASQLRAGKVRWYERA